MSTRKPTTKEQSKRFIEKARELGCDENPKTFERVFTKIVPPKKSKALPKAKAPRQSE